jgi:hypothetical protein
VKHTQRQGWQLAGPAPMPMHMNRPAGTSVYGKHALERHSQGVLAVAVAVARAVAYTYAMYALSVISTLTLLWLPPVSNERILRRATAN